MRRLSSDRARVASCFSSPLARWCWPPWLSRLSPRTSSTLSARTSSRSFVRTTRWFRSLSRASPQQSRPSALPPTPSRCWPSRRSSPLCTATTPSSTSTHCRPRTGCDAQASLLSQSESFS
eukprot:Amastigsp_a2276_21.p4 type:complete len:121 gc:universal Amastigsp_a2276_21:425-787(+)